MSSPTQTSGVSRFWLLLSAAAVVYVLLFGVTFLADPLGKVPVLDARENIAWAQKIRDSHLPAEPIYRALLYPLLLSKLPATSLPVAATIFGLFLHLCSAILTGLIALRLWRLSSAAWVSGFLFAVYPIALYFSGQVLDITLSITLFLGGVYSLLNCTSVTCDGRQSQCADRLRASQVTPLRCWALALFAGILGGLAVLARPNFLPAVFCFPLLPVLARALEKRVLRNEKIIGRTSPPRAGTRGRVSASLVASLCVALGLAWMLAAQGYINFQLSGQFRLLPWQGAYNLYAANREGANGKYYMQRVSFDEVSAGANTTRMESEQLYRQAVGEDAPLTIDAMNQYWRAQLIESITADPALWLGLMGRKVLYVFNDWEQYNNLSYAYHKARWSALRWNPLGWGVLLLVACVGLFIGYRQADRSALYGIALLGLAYTAGLLLFFVSARFRLPLVPLLCIAAGGCALRHQQILSLPLKRVLLCLIPGILLLSFGNWFQAKDRATFIQDELLLAKASSQAGDDLQALNLARAVLARDPGRAEAQGLELTSLFNLWLVTRQPAYWFDLESSLSSIDCSDAAVTFIRGVYHWRGFRPDEAIALWQSAVTDYGQQAQSSLDALQAIGLLPDDPGRSATVEKIRGILDL